MSDVNRPSKDEMMRWIKEFTKWPHRETGTPEGRESAEYVRDVFRGFGLKNVEIERVPSVCHDTKECTLKIGDKTINCFLANGTNRKSNIGSFSSKAENVEIVYLGKGLEEDFENVDVKGKIVICGVLFHPHNNTDFLKWFEDSKAYDPKNKLEKKRNVYNIFSPNNWPYNYLRAMENGAVGFIGVLQNFMDCNYYHEDYAELIDVDGYFELPAVWVSREDGSDIIDALKNEGDIRGTLIVDTEYQYKDALNVKGIIKGISEDIIVIHSHHDATGRGAVQDASGMSVVFSLAKYFSSLPAEEIKTTLMFLATDSHYTDYEGHDKFLDKRAENGEKIIMDFAIEHIGKEMELDSENNIILYDEPEARIMYVSDINNMPDTAYEIIKKYDLEKTMILPVRHNSGGAFKQGDVCSDAYCFNERGIPVVSMISAPMYLFHNSDDVDKVHEKSLEPVTMAYIELVLKFWNLFK